MYIVLCNCTLCCLFLTVFSVLYVQLYCTFYVNKSIKQGKYILQQKIITYNFFTIKFKKKHICNTILTYFCKPYLFFLKQLQAVTVFSLYIKLNFTGFKRYFQNILTLIMISKHKRID